MPTGQPRILLTTDCCSDMYGLLDWACSESFLVAMLVVLGVVLVWRVFERNIIPDDHDADSIPEASQRLNLSLKTSQRCRRHQKSEESLDDVRWSVSLEEINVKVSVDRTTEHTRKRAVSHGECSEGNVLEDRGHDSNTTALSTTTSLGIALKEREDNTGEPGAVAVSSVTVKGTNQLSDEGQHISFPYQQGTDNTSRSIGHFTNPHVQSHNEQCNIETKAGNLGGGELPEASEQCPVKHHTSVCTDDTQSLAEVGDAYPELDVIKAAICEAGDLDFIPSADVIESRAPTDQNTTSNAPGELYTDDNTTESSDNEWVVV